MYLFNGAFLVGMIKLTRLPGDEAVTLATPGCGVTCVGGPGHTTPELGLCSTIRAFVKGLVSKAFDPSH